MNKNIYLNSKSAISLPYKQALDDLIHELKKYITKKQENELLKKKLQIHTNNFNEAQYLQSACELSVCYFLARKFSNTFLYEFKANPPKDVDCVFSDNGFRFNLEVKCADFSGNENNKPGLHIVSMGRYDNIREVQEYLSVTFGSKYESIDVLPNLDNKLKDFLVSAHEKFRCATDNSELNVLVVCCDDALDMQRWYSYLFNNKGLFTDNSFISPDCYRNVDLIILSNIYHRHKSYQTKDKLKNHWKFEESFNIFFQNPHCVMQKNSAIIKLASLIPNYNNELAIYNVPCEASEYSKHEHAIKIPYFVSDQLIEKGFYYFQPES